FLRLWNKSKGDLLELNNSECDLLFISDGDLMFIETDDDYMLLGKELGPTYSNCIHVFLASIFHKYITPFASALLQYYFFYGYFEKYDDPNTHESLVRRSYYLSHRYFIDRK
ncbi:hypothetical protein ACJX0J_019954, partial [Zea mays]